MKKLHPKHIPEHLHILVGFIGGVAAVLVVMNASDNNYNATIIPSEKPAPTCLEEKKSIAVKDKQIKKLQLYCNGVAKKEPVAKKKVITTTQNPRTINPNWECITDSDCPSDLLICNPYNLCERLVEPSCSCKNNKTLVCKGKNNQAKHIGCLAGCTSLPSPRCL